MSPCRLQHFLRVPALLLPNLLQALLHEPHHHESVVMSAQTTLEREAVERFPCFGGSCGVWVQGDGPSGSPGQAAAWARRRLEAHESFEELMLLSECDRAGRQCGMVVPDFEEAIEYVRGLDAAHGE